MDKQASPKTQAKKVWVSPKWANYYEGVSSDFNVWSYFQNTGAGVIPTHAFSEMRFSDKIFEVFENNSEYIHQSFLIQKNKQLVLSDAYLLYKKDVIIYIKARNDYKDYSLTFWHLPDKKSYMEDFLPHVVQHKENQISVLIKNSYGEIATEPCDMTVPDNIDLELNYGEGFSKKHDSIVSKMNEKKASLFLFTGKPGTGKTTYIKYLSSKVKREFIYVPVGMVASLASPDMLSFLMERKKAIIVLEDAEKAVRTRDDNFDTDVVSTLLNMADGILGDVLNISIIATYNAERETVDKAFLRKGRLKFEHEFNALSIDETNRLLKHLNLEESDTGLTLAEIYNLSDETGHVEKAKVTMGFGATLK